MKKKLLTACLSLVFVAMAWSIYGDEDNYCLVSKIEVPAIMAAAQKLSKLADQVTPGSSVMIGAGVTALAFNPKFQQFDITKPVTLVSYADRRKPDQATLSWVIIMAKKSIKPLAGGIVTENSFVVKEDKQLAYLSYDGDLVDYAISQQIKPFHKKDDIYIEFYPANYLTNCEKHFRQLKKNTISKLLKNPERNQKLLNQLKIYYVRFDHLEKFLRQIKTVHLETNFQSDGIKLRLQFSPIEGSPLATFIKAQYQLKNTAGVGGILAQYISATGKIALTKSFKESILDYNRATNLEIHDQLDNQMVDSLGQLLTGWDGEFAFCHGQWQKKQIFYAELGIFTDQNPILKEFLKKKYPRIDAGIYQFNSIESDYADPLCCQLKQDKLAIAQGEFAAENSIAILLQLSKLERKKFTFNQGERQVFLLPDANYSTKSRPAKLSITFPVQQNIIDIDGYLSLDSLKYLISGNLQLQPKPPAKSSPRQP